MALLATLRFFVASGLDLQAEVFALRHQLAVLRRQAPHRPRLRRANRLVGLAKDAPTFRPVQPPCAGRDLWSGYQALHAAEAAA